VTVEALIAGEDLLIVDDPAEVFAARSLLLAPFE
jgi:hypothetical protein